MALDIAFTSSLPVDRWVAFENKWQANQSDSSFAAWCYVTSTDTSQAVAVALDGNRSPAAAEVLRSALYLRTVSGTNRELFLYTLGATTCLFRDQAVDLFPINTWFHLAYTHDATTTPRLHTDRCKVYINGSDIGAPSLPTNGSDGAYNAGNGNLCSGATGTVVGVNANRSGIRLAEMCQYDRVLSAAEIASLANGFTPPHFRQGLKFYAPDVREVTDEYGGTDENSNTYTVQPHPYTIRPSEPFIASINPSIAKKAMHHRQQMRA